MQTIKPALYNQTDTMFTVYVQPTLHGETNPATARAVAAPLSQLRRRWLRVLYKLRNSWTFCYPEKIVFLVVWLFGFGFM